MATNTVFPSADGIELPEERRESVEAKLARLEASTQKLQLKNVELRLRLEQRKSRWAFERQLLAIGGLGLLFMGLVVGLFLGLVVGPVRPLAAGAAAWMPNHVVIVIEENRVALRIRPGALRIAREQGEVIGLRWVVDTVGIREVRTLLL